MIWAFRSNHELYGTDRKCPTTRTSQTSRATWLTSNKSQYSVTSSEKAYANGQILPTPSVREFSFQELKTATRNFNADTLLAEGGFGKVYKGWFEAKQHSESAGGLAVAIKKLNSEGCQSVEEWQSEVKSWGGFHTQIWLNYWDIAGRMMSHSLYMNSCRGKAWKTIFLESYNAKISDFGFAKLGPSAGQSHDTTRVVIGAYGCAAPEYLDTGHYLARAMSTDLGLY